MSYFPPQYTDNITLSVVSVQDCFLALNDYLTYLHEQHTKLRVPMNKKEEYDKLVLEAKISTLTDRVYKLKSQLDKREIN